MQVLNAVSLHGGLTASWPVPASVTAKFTVPRGRIVSGLTTNDVCVHLVCSSINPFLRLGLMDNGIDWTAMF